MDFSSYKKEFTKKAQNRNYPEHIVSNCLKYAAPLIKKEVPVIYNTTHFSLLVGYSKSYIKRALFHTKFFYRTFQIPKKNGKKRQISEPLPSLKEIQDYILKNILYKIPVSRYAKCFVPKRSLLQHLKYHKNKRYVLTIDIKDFFPSIKFDSIEKIFSSIGYIDIISNLLAKLCTLDKKIPQGASTSPYLTNIYLKEFDEILGDLMYKQGINYSRYADDMAFSGEYINKDKVIAKVNELLNPLDLHLNPDKTKLMRYDQHQIITGITVNEKKLSVPKSVRRKIRQDLFFIKKNGLEEHIKKKKIKNKNYKKHLLGLVNYVLYIDPSNQEFKEYKSFLIKLL